MRRATRRSGETRSRGRPRGRSARSSAARPAASAHRPSRSRLASSRGRRTASAACACDRPARPRRLSCRAVPSTPSALATRSPARADAGHDAVRRDVGTARRGPAAAEVVARLDVAAPAREVGGEVVRERVLAGMRVGRARQDEQDGCHERQEAEAWHGAMFGPPTVHVSVTDRAVSEKPTKLYAL